MLNKPLLLVGACVVFGLGAMAANGAQDVGDKKKVRASDQGIVAGTDDNHWICEPLLVYDVSGATFVGAVHKNLTVYNNGRVSLAEFAPNITPRNVSKVMKAEEVERLRTMLVSQGARTLTDQELGVPDAPLHTISIFEGNTDATCHTFNYWVGGPGYGEVQQTIDSFIQTNFPPNER